MMHLHPRCLNRPLGPSFRSEMEKLRCQTIILQVVYYMMYLHSGSHLTSRCTYAFPNVCVCVCVCVCQRKTKDRADGMRARKKVPIALDGIRTCTSGIRAQWRIQDSSDRGAQDKTSWGCGGGGGAVSPQRGSGRPEKF